MLKNSSLLQLVDGTLAGALALHPWKLLLQSEFTEHLPLVSLRALEGPAGF